MNLRRALVALLAAALGGVGWLSAQEKLERFDAIWGSGPNDIWVVGMGPPPGTVVHWDGKAWKEAPFGLEVLDLESIWGSGPRDVFAVGRGGTVVHFDGRTWVRMAVPKEFSHGTFAAVTGRSPTDVYVLAQSGTETDPPVLLRYDGRTWTAQRLPVPFIAQGMAVTASDLLLAGYVLKDPHPKERRVFGVLARWRGDRWSVTGWDGRRLADPLVGGFGWTSLSAAGSAVLLVGQKEGASGDPKGGIALSAGGTWKLLPPVPVGEFGDANLALIAGDGTPIALYGAGFARYVGGRWSSAETPEDVVGAPKAAWGVSSADFYVLTDEEIVHVVRDRSTVVYKSTVGVAREAEQAQERAARDGERAWERAPKEAEQEISHLSEPAAGELGVPKYPGAKFDPRMSGEMSSDEEEYFIYTTADLVDKVVSFYERQTGKKALKSEAGSLIAVKGAPPWPELGVTIQPNAGTYPAAVKTMITIRRQADGP